MPSTSLTATSWVTTLSNELSILTVSVASVLPYHHNTADRTEKQGISTRFLDFFHSLDKSVGAKVVGEDKTVSEKINEHAAAVVGKAREVDQNRGVSAKFSDYYHKVLGTPIGQR